jgi:Lrp/AsnC family transcriptional regulator, leucine-responsive regulatory protein
MAEQSAAMDDIDRAILGELVHNGRASHRRLGAVAGLSANAAAERMRRLVRSGAITGFTAVVDQAAAGRGLSALIDVRLAPEQTNDGFERVLAGVDGIVYAAHVTGAFDYHLQVACRDTTELDALLRTLKRKLGAAHTETRVVLRTAIVRPG